MTSFAQAALLALAGLAITPTDSGEIELIAMISTMAKQQGEPYELFSIRVSDVQPSSNGSEGWVCGSFTGTLATGEPVEPREFVANPAERRIFLQPVGIGTTVDHYEQGANFYDASATWC
jgi:hypothetical protein